MLSGDAIYVRQTLYMRLSYAMQMAYYEMTDVVTERLPFPN